MGILIVARTAVLVLERQHRDDAMDRATTAAAIVEGLGWFPAVAHAVRRQSTVTKLTANVVLVRAPSPKETNQSDIPVHRKLMISGPTEVVHFTKTHLY